jgi:hypothetical protein
VTMAKIRAGTSETACLSSRRIVHISAIVIATR